MHGTFCHSLKAELEGWEFRAYVSEIVNGKELA
jgi:hypothetical protein